LVVFVGCMVSVFVFCLWCCVVFGGGGGVGGGGGETGADTSPPQFYFPVFSPRRCSSQVKLRYNFYWFDYIK